MHSNHVICWLYEHGMTWRSVLQAAKLAELELSGLVNFDDAKAECAISHSFLILRLPGKTVIYIRWTWKTKTHT